MSEREMSREEVAKLADDLDAVPGLEGEALESALTENQGQAVVGWDVMKQILRRAGKSRKEIREFRRVLRQSAPGRG